MGRVKALGFAYRAWARRALFAVGQDAPVSLLVKDKPGDVYADLFEVYKPDVAFFYGWSWQVPDEIVNRWMCIGLHPSPLPAYRGGSPLQHQIIQGEIDSAVTLFRMTSETDAGAIYSQVPYSLKGSLSNVLRRVSDVAILETIGLLELIAGGETLRFREQPSGAQVWRRRKSAESEITVEELATSSALELHNKIRALSVTSEDYPAAFVRCRDGERLYLTGSCVEGK